MIFEVKRDDEERWFLGSEEEFESGISCFINNYTYRKVEERWNLIILVFIVYLK